MARIIIPNYPHHVVQRGVRSMQVFSSNGDRVKYLKLFSEQCRIFDVEVLSWCLMTNHVHFVVIPRQSGTMARAIGEAHRRYTRYVNFREKVRGYLFQGRFYSCVLDERHTIAAIRYIERNPVRAGMKKNAWDYKWSSAAFRVDHAQHDLLVKDRHVFDNSIDWKALLMNDPGETDVLRKKIKTGRVCGNGDFIDKVEKLAGRRLRPLSRWETRKGGGSLLGT
jgi:putative transposase